jgi:F-type H+-transporting ATPase subunit a
MVHYNYLHSLQFPELEKLIVALVIGAGMVMVGAQAMRRLKSAGEADKLIVPEPRASLFGFVDLLIETFIKVHDSILGKEHREYLPFCGTIFFFLFASNLVGLIPGMPAVTTTVWVNVAIALIVFVFFNYQGIKHNGFIPYMKHFCGPVWALAWLILPIELLSTMLRVFTLNLRIYWNISADHMVLGIFSDLVPLFVPCLFYAFGTFVAFMQAFVFTMLTMIYILLAIQHEEEH